MNDGTKSYEIDTDSDSDIEEKRIKAEFVAPQEDPQKIINLLCSSYRFLVNYGYFEPYYEWCPYEVLIRIFENLKTRDLLAAGLVCRRWCEATQYYKLTRKVLLHLQTFKYCDADYPMNRFANCSRWFPNVKFTIVKFTPKNDFYWLEYGDRVEELTFNSCMINKPEFLRIIRTTCNLQALTIVRCEDLYKTWKVVKKNHSLLFPFLTKIEFEESSLLKMDIFNFMMASAPNLTSLTLANCFTLSKPKDRSDILDAIIIYLKEKACQIKILNLVNTLTDDMFLEKMSKIDDLKLVEFHLTFNGLVSPDLKSGIIMLIRKQVDLEILDLTDSKGLTNFCLMEICRYMKRLKKLILNKCWMVNDVGLREVNKLLHLEVLNIASCDRVTDLGVLEGLIPNGKKFLNLKELYLSLLPYMSILSIYRLSQHFDDLRVLDLSGSSNSITDEALQMIFRYQLKLTHLNLDCCAKISDYGITGLSENEEYSPYTINNLKDLVYVNLSGCYQISDESMIKTFDLKELKEISLARCHNITQKGIIELIKKCKYLESIDFSECFHVNDDCVEILTKETFHLQTLKLNGLQLTDNSIWSIKRNCKYLKNLYIRRCNKITENPFMLLKSVRYIHNQ